MVEEKKVEAEVAEVPGVDPDQQEKDFTVVSRYVLAYRVLRDEIKMLKERQDSHKIVILEYVQQYGSFIFDGGKSQMKTRRGTISYDWQALDTLCAAWAGGNKTEQKYARLISAHHIVKSDTTYLEVK